MSSLVPVDPSNGNRLFSNVELNGDRLHHQPGSLLGCTALIAGTTIGAGILALPAVTLPSGILPSTVLLIAVWLYALASGLLIAEVNVNAMHQSGRSGLGLLALIEATLGGISARFAGSLYLFMHYALLVAYLSQGGEILHSALQTIGGSFSSLPLWTGTVLFASIFGSILYFGHDRLIEQLNNVFVAIVLLSFMGLLGLGITKFEPAQILVQQWQALSPAISVMFVALFYHNVIPVVTTQLEGDVVKIRRSIVIGSAIPLVMFLAWNAVILGSVSLEVLQEMQTDSAVFDPLRILRNGEAGAWLGVLVSIFSEFAIATSFIGFVYGLLDFFKDALNITPNDRSQRLPLYSLVLLPSVGFSTVNPSLFFTALDYVGTFSISILGGIIPAVMAWQQRYREQTSYLTKPLVPGGKLTLALIIGIAIAIIMKHLSQ